MAHQFPGTGGLDVVALTLCTYICGMEREKKSEKWPTKKSDIIFEIENCDNPYLLTQINELLKRKEILKPFHQIGVQFPYVLVQKPPRDLSLKHHLKPPTANPLTKYDYLATPIMYFISLIMLLIISAIINNFSISEMGFQLNPFLIKLGYFYWVIWLLYVLDFLAIILLARKSKTKMASSSFIIRCLGLVFPPIRLGTRHLSKPNYIWIPFYHWAKCNEGLLNHIKQKFSLPMIIIALLIIPVILIEWQFHEQAADMLQSDLSFILDMVQGFIWMAFTFEFILMISISNEKFEYAIKNWIDILIILLPFISFMRTFRVVKMARLSQLSRGYKLRGLLMKARQGLFFASFFYRILTIRPDFQIKKLKKKLDKNHEERERLEEDLIKLFEVIQKQKKRE
ncbi:MAG: hypothetical protein WD398_13190 [Cyclobacteriaceae bacterium]